MAKTYERIRSTNIPQEQKGGTRSIPKKLNVLGEGSLFSFYYMIELLRLF